ncbi:RXT2-like protein [Cladorrhinum samala]|uniref:RXT2-like protein n=1 Tax=Cladorrhinum samala TaxID=585594 RepID=A0AAV9HBP3_9PEZI|nr:RXT2-like protein [Cladorrhinum samala]
MSNQLQQALVVEAILGIRRKLKRKDYDSDSDSSIDQNTNRGNKLKKRARFVTQGRLASSTGPQSYKEVAEHAGYQRAIIQRNPPLIDEEGYDIESDDDEEQIQEAIASASTENPYSEIRLEQIFAPLTSVTDLPGHPTLSRPFTSKALTELADQARVIMQRENKALWKAKPLLTKLVGDNTWAPCGLMEGPGDSDELLFTDTISFFNRPAHPAAAAAASATVNGTQGLLAAGGVGKGKEVERAGSRLQDGVVNGEGKSEPNGDEIPAQINGAPKPDEADKPNGAAPQEDAGDKADEDVEMADAAEQQSTERLPSITYPAIRLEPPDGRSNGRAESTPVSPSSPDAPPFIHPLFLAPPAARQDRNMGIPDGEADEVRRLLQAYVQKQEEVCRGAKRLYEQLLRADRLRSKVLMWSKAEAHSGPNRDMSDGEDWYDKEEWGLTEDLKKGEDEVEEDLATTQKKTRNRK